MSITSTTLIVTPACDISGQRIGQLVQELDGPPVIYHFPYTPPYENFSAIRKMQLLMQRTAAQEVQPALVIDVTEWAGHTSEDYFGAAIRFLADHPSYHPMFLLAGLSDKQNLMMAESLNFIFRIGILKDHCFDVPKEMQKFLSDNFSVSGAAAADIAKLIVQSELPCRYGIIERLMDDLQYFSHTSEITGQHLRKLKTKINGQITAQSLLEAAQVL